MILQDERNRLGLGIVGALVIHAAFFLAIQLGVHIPPATPSVSPIYVELNAPLPVIPETKSSDRLTTPESAIAPANPSGAKPAAAAASTAAPRAVRSVVPSYPASGENDPLARAPSAADLAAQQSADSTKQSAAPPVPQRNPGPTAADSQFLSQENSAANQFRQLNPLLPQRVPSPAAGLASGAAPTSSSPAARSLAEKVESTAIAVAQAQNAGGSSASAGGATGSPSQAESRSGPSAPGYADPRLRFQGGSPRGLVSQGRLNLDDNLVKAILKNEPNHPPVIKVTVGFTVDSNGFVTLQPGRYSGYTQLDLLIRNLFEGEVFMPAPGSAPAAGEITYIIQTQAAR